LALPLGARDAVEARVKVQVLLDGQVFVQPEPLRHVGDARLHLLRVRGGVDVQDADLSSVRDHQPRDQADEGGLAGSVRTDQRRQLGVPDVQGHAIERFHLFPGLAAKRLADVAHVEDGRGWPFAGVHGVAPFSDAAIGVVVGAVVVVGAGAFNAK